MKKTKNSPTIVTLTSLVLASGSVHASLIAHYEFEDFTDSSGNGHTASVVGSGTIFADPDRGNVYQNPTTTTPRSSLNIDSTVAIPSLPANSGLTLATWLRRDVYTAGTNASFGPGNLVAAVSLGQGGDTPIATIGINNSGGIITFMEGDGGADQVFWTSADNLITDETWVHVAVTFDRVGNFGKQYLNGVQTGADFDISAVGDGELNWAAAQIGTLAPGGNVVFDFQGRIDDVRIYDEVLSPTAIQALAVPEPTGSALLSLGGLLALLRRRR